MRKKNISSFLFRGHRVTDDPCREFWNKFGRKWSWCGDYGTKTIQITTTLKLKDDTYLRMLMSQAAHLRLCFLYLIKIVFTTPEDANLNLVLCEAAHLFIIQILNKWSIRISTLSVVNPKYKIDPCIKTAKAYLNLT